MKISLMLCLLDHHFYLKYIHFYFGSNTLISIEVCVMFVVRLLINCINCIFKISQMSNSIMLIRQLTLHLYTVNWSQRTTLITSTVGAVLKQVLLGNDLIPMVSASPFEKIVDRKFHPHFLIFSIKNQCN